jgi:hypothetical protein
MIVNRGRNASPEVRTVMRKRIGACLIASRRRGVQRNEGVYDGFKGWVVA